MTSAITGAIVFLIVFGGAVLGFGLRRVLPEHHRSSDSRDVVKLAMGLVATMAALVLSLLISSAKGSYDTQSSEVAQLAANVALLDRILALYGSESQDARDLLRRTVQQAMDRMWPRERSARADLSPVAARGDQLYDRIQALASPGEAKSALRASALQIAIDLRRTRSLLFAQRGVSIPVPFLIILVFWAAALFVSFGLFATPNTTVVVSLLVCALSIAGAIFLILELDQPFRGFIQVSSAPLQEVLAQLGK